MEEYCYNDLKDKQKEKLILIKIDFGDGHCGLCKKLDPPEPGWTLKL